MTTTKKGTRAQRAGLFLAGLFLVQFPLVLIAAIWLWQAPLSWQLAGTSLIAAVVAFVAGLEIEDQIK